MLFSLGAFAHQMLSGLLYALVTDTFEKRSALATATGMAGMFGYFGGAVVLAGDRKTGQYPRL